MTDEHRYNENMGVVCSQNLRKVGKHSIAPKQSAKDVTIGVVSDVVSDVVENVPIKKRSAFEAPVPAPRLTLSHGLSSPVRSLRKPIETPRSKPPTIRNVSSPRRCSHSEIFSNQFNSPRPSTSSIDINSILYRANEAESVIAKNPFDHRSANSVNDSTASRNSDNGDVLDRRKDHIGLSKFYYRFSGSVQTLFNPNNGRAQSRRHLSASENNLSSLSARVKNGATAQKRFSSSSDYCPSVLFNRISNKRKTINEKVTSDRSLSFAKWKNYFVVNVLRKKRDTNARKT